MPSSPSLHLPATRPAAAPPSSPLMLCDHLIALAQEADRAGYPGTASRLVALATGMFRERPKHPPQPS